MAALALPGLTGAVSALAESSPESTVLSYKQLYYSDYQKGLKRITVNAPSLYVMVPIGEKWSIDGSAVLDSVSGASPRYHTVVSGASRMEDSRTAFDTHLTHYRERSAYSISYSNSREHDYASNAGSLDARFSTDDNNTTFNIGAGASFDKINPTNNIVTNARKNSRQYIAGITQALTSLDLVQLQLGYATGNGYFNDAYKTYDNRPTQRNQDTAVLRWNHHVEDSGTTFRTSYRYYRDSWKVRAHTLGIDWAQAAFQDFVFTSSLNYYSQSSASFYIDPPPGGGLPAIPPGMYSSLDQRLSAFGALSFSQKVEWNISNWWTVDLKGEFYQQRSEWRLGGKGSPGLDPFNFYAIQLGFTHRF